MERMKLRQDKGYGDGYSELGTNWYDCVGGLIVIAKDGWVEGENIY